MNYYEHHIGDYAEATAHLTFVEDAAYSRMIRVNTCRERVQAVAPELMGQGVRGKHWMAGDAA